MFFKLLAEVSETLEIWQEDYNTHRPHSAFALDAARAKEALLHFDDAKHRALFFAGYEDVFAQTAIDVVDCVTVHAGQFSRLQGGEIG